MKPRGEACHRPAAAPRIDHPGSRGDLRNVAAQPRKPVRSISGTGIPCGGTDLRPSRPSRPLLRCRYAHRRAYECAAPASGRLRSMWARAWPARDSTVCPAW